MQLGDNLHLTYCLNVHAGESWAEQFAAIRESATAIARRVAGDKPFGLGLRLSAASAAELVARPELIDELRRYLESANLYVLTVNAFPYGRFHGVPVKDAVYQPDWSDPARLAYTLNVAGVMAQLLPEWVEGSISTAPLTFKGWPDWPAAFEAGLANFAAAGQALEKIASQSQRRLLLAMEPEPGCYPETIDEVCAVFERLPSAVRRLDTLGVCYDTAHQAVEFEDLAAGLRQLRERQIRVGKIQLSAALRGPTTEAVRADLVRFDDPVYLHQCCLRQTDGAIRRSDNLRPMLDDASAWQAGGEIRVHYHVPLFVEQTGTLATTADLLQDAEFRRIIGEGITSTLEIETYTWDVWQTANRAAGAVADGIVREFDWVRTLVREISDQ